MAAYAPLTLESAAKSQKPKYRKIKGHLRNQDLSQHGTDKCFYCNAFAQDLGLLVAPIT